MRNKERVTVERIENIFGIKISKVKTLDGDVNYSNEKYAIETIQGRCCKTDN